jgi:hypothetical protein
MQKTFTTTGKATIEVFFQDGKIPHRIEVKDSRGMLYFFRDLNRQQRLKFNIAKADTFTLNVPVDTITVLPISIHLLNSPLPAPDRSEVKDFKVVYNPELKITPARNYYVKGRIETGDVYRKQPYPIRVFILLHEYGHFLYSDESNADIWAANEFIRRGYNNSSAYYALANVLNFNSQKNRDRLIKLFKNLHR